MVGSCDKGSVAATIAGRAHVVSGTALLTRNLLSAIGSLHEQKAIQAIVRLAGPLTTKEILSYTTTHAPHVTHRRLQRLLTRLRSVGVVAALPVPGRHVVFWCLPGQQLPARWEARVAPVDARRIVERRAPGTVSAVPGSWWVGVSRQELDRRMRARWSQ